MSPYASSADVVTLWRALSVEETTRADALTVFASAIIRTRVPTLDARITAGLFDAAVATLVCVQMVLRTMRNPAGIAAETNGPWSVTYGSTGAASRLYLTDEEYALLSGLAPGERAGRVAVVHSRNRFLCHPGWRAEGAEV